MKLLLLQAFGWVVDNLYEIALSAVCFLVAVEILDTWACWAVLFGSFLFWILKKGGVIKPLRK